MKWGFLLSLLFVVLGALLISVWVHSPGQVETATVESVIDGDTVVLESGDRVRLLGIDTPEKGQYYFREATEKLEELVRGRKVRLEKEDEDRDKYDRLLRYIHLDTASGDILVNLELVRLGLAKTYMLEEGDKYREGLLEAEREAREDGLGIWKLQGEKGVFCLGIFYLHYNAKGNDNQNLNNEYVAFRNKCEHPLNLDGWYLEDGRGERYIFRDFTVHNKSKFSLHTGSGKDNRTDLYWGQSRAVWNNAGDWLRMWNPEGGLILNYSY